MSIAHVDDSEDRTSPTLARWGGSLLLVLGAHAAVGVGMLSWRVAVEEAAAPPAAVMLDLAPMPEVAPPEPTPTLESMLPEPEVLPEPVIEPMVEPEPIPEVTPEPLPPVPAEVALPEPPPKPKPKPKETPKPTPPKPTPPKVERERPKPPAEVKPRTDVPPTQAAPSMPSAPSAAATPSPLPPAAHTSNAVPTWQGLVVSHLERHKRYPRIAQMRRQQGVPQVRIVIDRQGRVLAAKLEKGSGFEALDEETVALAERASPLPAPPPEMAQDRIELVVPVQYFLR
jgi:TonB family C-terminal domain